MKMGPPQSGQRWQSGRPDIGRSFENTGLWFPDQDRRAAGAARARLCRHPDHDQSAARAAAIKGAYMADAAACSNRSATFPPPKQRRTTMRRSMSSLWWRDSNQTASGKPSAVQTTNPLKACPSRKRKIQSGGFR